MQYQLQSVGAACIRLASFGHDFRQAFIVRLCCVRCPCTMGMITQLRIASSWGAGRKTCSHEFSLLSTHALVGGLVECTRGIVDIHVGPMRCTMLSPHFLSQRSQSDTLFEPHGIVGGVLARQRDAGASHDQRLDSVRTPLDNVGGGADS
jgi:hypothetical protein